MSTKKRSLEEAIKIAKVSIENDENKIIIDRTRFASRKNKRISELTVSKGPLNDIGNLDDSMSESTFWTEKLQSLFKENRQHKNEIDIILKRNESLENYVKLIEKKLAVTSSAQSNENKSCDEINSLKEKLHIFETMTGMTLKTDIKTGSTICTMKNTVSRLVTRFSVNTIDSTEENASGITEDVHKIEFRPIANIHLLPQYLHGEVECSKEVAPVLLGDIIRKVYEEQQQQE